MKRWFVTALIIGALLVGSSPFVRRYNKGVWELRHDTGSAAYFMRKDIRAMCSSGGGMLIVVSVVALWRLRSTRGRFAQRKAILPVLLSEHPQ